MSNTRVQLLYASQQETGFVERMLPKRAKHRAWAQGGETLSTSVKSQILSAKGQTTSLKQLEQGLALAVLAPDKMEWK